MSGSFLYRFDVIPKICVFGLHLVGVPSLDDTISTCVHSGTRRRSSRCLVGSIRLSHVLHSCARGFPSYPCSNEGWQFTAGCKSLRKCEVDFRKIFQQQRMVRSGLKPSQVGFDMYLVALIRQERSEWLWRAFVHAGPSLGTCRTWLGDTKRAIGQSGCLCADTRVSDFL